MRNAVQEICRAVEWVDDEAVGFIRAVNFALLFHKKAVAGTITAQVLKDNFFGRFIGFGDKIRWAFARNLQMLSLAKITQQRTRRLTRRRLHDSHKGGYPRYKITCH